MRSILNTYSSATIILMVVGGTAAIAVIGVLVVRRIFPNLADGPYEETVEGLRVIFELVFALILAFVIGSILNTFSNAEATIAAEASTLAHMKRSNDALPIDKQVPLTEGLDQYIHAIVDTEWETMRNGEASPRAAAALESLYAVYQSFTPAPEGVEAEFYTEAADQLPELVSARRERLGLSAAELPVLLRIFLPVGALFLLVLEYRPKMPLWPRLFHMGLLAVVVSFCFLLTIVLDYPFSGDVAVSSDIYKTGALAAFWASDEPHELAPAEQELALSPSELAGVWNSDNYGEIVFRQVGDEMRAVYRAGNGSVVGSISPSGVFRGWWCDSLGREPGQDAGEVEWTLVSTTQGKVAFGNWRYGTQEPYRGGWELKKVGGPEPPDLAPRFDDPSTFCQRP